MRRTIATLLAAGLLLVGLVGPATANPNRAPAPGDASIAEIALASPDFNDLVAALAYVDAEEGTELVDLFLNGTDQYTVFAPTDEAFADLYATLNAVLPEFGGAIASIEDVPAPIVLAVLQYHVTEGRRAANSVVPRAAQPRQIQTLLGASFSVDRNGVITDALGPRAAIGPANISASNGIIHVVDQVILPVDVATLRALLGLED